MIGRVVRTSIRPGSRLVQGSTRLGIRRHISWRDFNPFTYVASGYESAKNYWYGQNIPTDPDAGSGGTGGKGGKSDGTNSIELSTVADPVPVFLDLSSVRKEDDDEQTLAKIQNFGNVSLLIFFRFRKYILRVLGKYIKVLFEDHYEYLLLVLMFFML